MLDLPNFSRPLAPELEIIKQGGWVCSREFTSSNCNTYVIRNATYHSQLRFTSHFLRPVFAKRIYRIYLPDTTIRDVDREPKLEIFPVNYGVFRVASIPLGYSFSSPIRFSLAVYVLYIRSICISGARYAL